MSDSFHCDSAYTDGFGLLSHKPAFVFHSIGQPFHRHSYNPFPRACNSPDPILREFPWRPIGGEGELGEGGGEGGGREGKETP
jgi:hypothetical protein